GKKDNKNGLMRRLTCMPILIQDRQAFTCLALAMLWKRFWRLLLFMHGPGSKCSPKRLQRPLSSDKRSHVRKYLFVPPIPCKSGLPSPVAAPRRCTDFPLMPLLLRRAADV